MGINVKSTAQEFDSAFLIFLIIIEVAEHIACLGVIGRKLHHFQVMLNRTVCIAGSFSK